MIVGSLNPVLVSRRNAKHGEDHGIHEYVVDGQAFLDEVAGQVGRSRASIASTNAVNVAHAHFGKLTGPARVWRLPVRRSWRIQRDGFASG